MPAMRMKHITKQAAHPAAVTNSSETQPTITNVNWKRLLLDSPAATGDPLLDAALRLNQSHEDCTIAQVNYDNGRIAAESHKLPKGMDQDRVASTTLKQQQINLRLSKDSFREVLNQQQKPACKVLEQASNPNPSKGPVAQGNGSSAARGSSTTPSANPAVTRTHASESAAASGKGGAASDVTIGNENLTLD
ncbi:TPA: hypothetical protein ACH3X3_011990 [Trebouxia sp. C0006]